MDARILRAFWARLALALTIAFAPGLTSAETDPGPSDGYQLIMIHQQGCYECQAWDNLLGPIYPKTSEGAFAPLRRVDLRGDQPEDLDLKFKARITPTFILVKAGKELGRIEGNPGDEFFWIYLDRLLSDHTDFEAEPS